MKIAVLSESEADEAVLRVLVEGILGTRTEPVPHIPLRSRGWPAVRNLLPVVLLHLQYRTDADALVVLVDSNHSPVHQASHRTEEADTRCRLCELQRSASRTLQGFSPTGEGRLIRVAIGLAVPSLEAWLRCGHDTDVSEAAWQEGLNRKRDPYTRNELKNRVYGTDRPGLGLQKRRGIEEAERLTQDLATLEDRFPVGFGSFAARIRTWIDR